MSGALSLTDLVTILYRPRETMRRVLDAGRDRWVPQIVIFAFVCASIGDTDMRRLPRVVPGLMTISVVGIALLALAGGALLWLMFVALVAWIATPIGRFLGGSGTARDMRAALAWSLVPVIWSGLYRIPLAVYKSQFDVAADSDAKKVLFDLMAHGGCAIAVVVMALQLTLYAVCLWVGSNTVGEAQRFSSWKGLANLGIVFVIPFAVALAAFFAMRS